MKNLSFRNTVTVRISQKNFEHFINGCKKENIVLKDIYQNEDSFLCTLAFKSFKGIRKVVRESKVSLEIVKKRGAGYFVHNHRKRYGFFAGALLAVMIFVYLTSCIWVVDVVGNDITSDEEIKEVVSRLGIGIGDIRYGKKISQIKNRALIELDSLAWLWVTIDGTRAVVEVREKGEGNEVYDSNNYCNLVASHSGQIVDMRVRRGRKTVERNMAVSEGDLLVSGVSSTKYMGNRYINANGEVIAKTWRSMEDTFSNKKTVKTKTGNSVKRKSLVVFNTKISFPFFKKVGYDNYVKKKQDRQMKLFENIYLPLTFTTETFYEIILENENLSEDEIIQNAKKELTQKIEKMRPKGSKTINVICDHSVNEDGAVFVSVTVESLENIAVEKKIDVETLEENTSGEGY